MRKMIGEEEHASRDEAAEIVGMATSTFDKLLVKNRKGKLKFPLPLYQPGGPGTPMWFSIQKLKKWIADVVASGGRAY